MRIGTTTLVRLSGRLRSAFLDAGAVRIDPAAFLLPETGEKPAELEPDIEDPRDEADPALGPRAGFAASGDRRCEGGCEDDYEDGALRKTEPSHTVSPFRAAPGRAGVGRAGASRKNWCPRANKFTLKSSEMSLSGV